MRPAFRRTIWVATQRCSPWAPPPLTQAVANEALNHARDDSGTSGRGLAAAAAAAAACVAAALATAGAAHGDALPAGAGAGNRTQEELVASFGEWIRAHGGHMDGVALEKSKENPSAGLGLASTAALPASLRARWLGRRLGALLTGQTTVAAAEVPLDLALTAAAAAADPDLGSSYSELMQLGLLDERSAVVAMLAIERLRGERSRFAPWLRLLPDSFPTPLWFDEAQLGELRGTTLAAATATHRRMLKAQWERLAPALGDMLRQVGVETEATFEDWLWAYSAFWSRGQSLPVPVSDSTLDTGSDAASSHSSSSSGGSSSSSSDGVRIEVMEGLVPGLDFANHSMQANCWWEVAPSGRAAGGVGNDDVKGGLFVQLVTNRATVPKRPGAEMTISYGDKSNEELLMLYGFAVPNNPHGQLMLACPLPPRDEWGEETLARLHLLSARGLAPQLFLPSAHLAAPATRRGSGGGFGSAAAAAGGGVGGVLPPDARRVLEVFVMEPSELAAALEALEENEEIGSSISGGGGSSSGSGGRKAGGAGGKKEETATERVERLGTEMAVITTAVRLLELKVLELEAEDEGTGPLEADDSRLASPGAARLAPWLRACLVYRAGQKRLARGYLAAARGELQATLRALQAAVEEEGAVQRQRSGGGGGAGRAG